MSSSSLAKRPIAQRKLLSSNQIGGLSKSASSGSHLPKVSRGLHRSVGVEYLNSPYNQVKMPQHRSSSNIKDRSLQSLNSTPLARLPPSGKLAKTVSSKNLKTQKILERTKKAFDKVHSKQLEKPQRCENAYLHKEALALERQLHNGVLHLKSGESGKDLYANVFDKVIRLSEFGEVLAQVKDRYEDTLDKLRSGPMYEENLSLKSTFMRLQEKYQHLLIEKARMLKDFQKTITTNAEMCREVDSLDFQYSQLQGTFWEFSKENKADIPKNEVAWKYLLAEHKNYESIYQKLVADNKVFTNNSKKLDKLFAALREKGISIEDIDKPEASKESGDCPDESVDLTNIVEDQPKLRDRPHGVPVLSLEDVEPNSVSSVSDNDESEYFEEHSEDR